MLPFDAQKARQMGLRPDGGIADQKPPVLDQTKSEVIKAIEISTGLEGEGVILPENVYLAKLRHEGIAPSLSLQVLIYSEKAPQEPIIVHGVSDPESGIENYSFKFQKASDYSLALEIHPKANGQQYAYQELMKHGIVWDEGAARLSDEEYVLMIDIENGTVDDIRRMPEGWEEEFKGKNGRLGNNSAQEDTSEADRIPSVKFTVNTDTTEDDVIDAASKIAGIMGQEIPDVGIRTAREVETEAQATEKKPLLEDRDRLLNSVSSILQRIGVLKEDQKAESRNLTLLKTSIYKDSDTQHILRETFAQTPPQIIYYGANYLLDQPEALMEIGKYYNTQYDVASGTHFIIRVAHGLIPNVEQIALPLPERSGKGIKIKKEGEWNTPRTRNPEDIYLGETEHGQSIMLLTLKGGNIYASSVEVPEKIESFFHQSGLLKTGYWFAKPATLEAQVESKLEAAQEPNPTEINEERRAGKTQENPSFIEDSADFEDPFPRGLRMTDVAETKSEEAELASVHEIPPLFGHPDKTDYQHARLMEKKRKKDEALEREYRQRLGELDRSVQIGASSSRENASSPEKPHSTYDEILERVGQTAEELTSIDHEVQAKDIHFISTHAPMSDRTTHQAFREIGFSPKDINVLVVGAIQEPSIRVQSRYYSDLTFHLNKLLGEGYPRIHYSFPESSQGLIVLDGRYPSVENLSYNFRSPQEVMELGRNNILMMIIEPGSSYFDYPKLTVTNIPLPSDWRDYLDDESQLSPVKTVFRANIRTHGESEKRTLDPQEKKFILTPAEDDVKNLISTDRFLFAVAGLSEELLYLSDGKRSIPTFVNRQSDGSYTFDLRNLTQAEITEWTRSASTNLLDLKREGGSATLRITVGKDGKIKAEIMTLKPDFSRGDEDKFLHLRPKGIEVTEKPEVVARLLNNLQTEDPRSEQPRHILTQKPKNERPRPKAHFKAAGKGPVISATQNYNNDAPKSRFERKRKQAEAKPQKGKKKK